MDSELLFDLYKKTNYESIKQITDELNPREVPFEDREIIFNIAYISNFHLGEYSKCQYWLSQFEFCYITNDIVLNANNLFSVLNKKVIASFDPSRVPLDSEIVIVYGNYPDWHLALPCSSKLFRHVSLFFDMKHDSVEYHPSWEKFDCIYIINLKERTDRYYDTLTTLCKVAAPLHRIHHFDACKDSREYVGCTKSHMEVLKHFKESGHTTCMILEDDFTFIDDIQHVWNSLERITTEPIEYTLCFLAMSKFYERNPVNDFLSESKGCCTASSGYIVTRDSVDLLYSTVAEGYSKMIQEYENPEYCIDRYWTKLDKLYFFRKKLGFQKISYSNNINSVGGNLD